MNTQEAYNTWAAQYDTNDNKTRDLEAQALRATLADISFDNCLEIGCGTGKNTVWLLEKAQQVMAVDFSAEMLAKAKAKIHTEKVTFIQADITNAWTFGKAKYDLVTFSLVLEHIDNLEFTFAELAPTLKPGGHVYVGELHPFKQYSGSKARFETAAGVQVVECFNHHISDFIQAANKNGLSLIYFNEYFDEPERTGIPRVLTLLFIKK